MQALEVIRHVIRTRVSATIEEHENIIRALNEIEKLLASNQETPEDIPVPGKVSSVRSAQSSGM